MALYGTHRFSYNDVSQIHNVPGVCVQLRLCHTSTTHLQSQYHCLLSCLTWWSFLGLGWWNGYTCSKRTTPSYISHIIQLWLGKNFQGLSWFESLCFYVWRKKEINTRQHPHNTNDSLKVVIVDMMANMNDDYLIWG